MQPDLIMLHVVAMSISLFGGGLIWRHRAQWSKQQNDMTLERGERLFLQGQYRRRMQSSAMLCTLGILLNASNEFLVPWQKLPQVFFVYVSVMLILVAWMVLLALGDMFAARMVHQAALDRLKEQQRRLEQSLGQRNRSKYE